MDLKIAGRKAIICASSKGLGKACASALAAEGVDVWITTPIKLREASGTSGMKVPPNGGINMSVLDGWWPEAYDGDNGWAIDAGSFAVEEEQDRADTLLASMEQTTAQLLQARASNKH